MAVVLVVVGDGNPKPLDLNPMARLKKTYKP